MQMSGSHMQNISEFLRLKHCPVSKNWLTEFLSENPLLTGPECFQKILNMDITRIGLFSLPNDIFPMRIKGVLEGNIFLQIVSIRDIGSSFYSQLSRFEGSYNTNNDVAFGGGPEEKSVVLRGQRCLLLELTDGRQSIQAMEFEPIPCVSVETPRGSKILLKGSLELRRGVILLRSDSVTLLGGLLPDLDTNTCRQEELKRALRESTK